MATDERSRAFLSMLDRLHERHLTGVEGVREIWLVRHGDAYTGMTALAEGPLDPQLSEVGRHQAALLGRRLAGVRIDQVWASDLRRALETARFVAEPHRLPVLIDPRLREVRTHWDEGALAALGEPGEYPFPEAEQQVLERVRGAVEEVAGNLPDGGRAVMVTHNVAIGVYVSAVLGLGWGKLHILPTYTSVTILAVKGDQVVVRSVADATHLSNPRPEG